MDESILIYQCYQNRNTSILAWLFNENKMMCWKYKETDKDLLEKITNVREKRKTSVLEPLVFLRSEKDEIDQLKKKLGMSATESLVVFR